MRICVIGAGIAGLSAAFHLTGLEDVHVTLLERAPHAGGRADVRDGGEHCPRIFLDDYRHLFEILRQIPCGQGGNVHDNLRPVVRYCHTERSGWVALSHLYRFRSREITIRDRIDAVRTRTRTPLLADRAPQPNTNRYGSLRHYHPSSIARVAINLARSRRGYALDGPTDELLVDPWVRHLVRAGVDHRPATPVEEVASHRTGVLVRTAAGWEPYDAAIITAFLPDVLALLPGTALAQRRSALPHTHCVCITIRLDPREAATTREEVGLYCRAGLTVLVQPGAGRCVVLSVRSASTDTAWVVDQVASMLALSYPITQVAVRQNATPSEALYTAEHIRASDVVVASDRVLLAGSYLRSDYPLDSAECAARTAAAAVSDLRRLHGLVPRRPCARGLVKR